MNVQHSDSMLFRDIMTHTVAQNSSWVNESCAQHLDGPHLVNN